MKKSKIKILFVVMDFWQAGAERYAYEVDSAINKELFDITILSIRGLNESDKFTDHYYREHLGLGSKIVFLQDFYKSRGKLSLIGKKIANRLKLATRSHEQLHRFFFQFDTIAWMGEYTFAALIDRLPMSIVKNSVTHVMSSKFQNPTFFAKYPHSEHCTFTSGFDDEEQRKEEFSDFKDYEHITYQLHLNIQGKQNNWKFHPGRTNKKIGVFTRLDPMKPLDPFLYAFHLILDKLPSAEFHLYGSGDPVRSGVDKYVRHLGIEKNVFYRGHQEDIMKTAIDDELDLVWFHGYKNRPAGYAGLDICLTGVPQLLWDFYEGSSHTAHADPVYPIYRNLQAFVDKSISILCNEREATGLSQKQFNNVVEKQDMKKNIHILESLYTRLALGKKVVNNNN